MLSRNSQDFRAFCGKPTARWCLSSDQSFDETQIYSAFIISATLAFLLAVLFWWNTSRREDLSDWLKGERKTRCQKQGRLKRTSTKRTTVLSITSTSSAVPGHTAVGLRVVPAVRSSRGHLPLLPDRLCGSADAVEQVSGSFTRLRLLDLVRHIPLRLYLPGQSPQLRAAPGDLPRPVARLFAGFPPRVAMATALGSVVEQFCVRDCRYRRLPYKSVVDRQ